MKGQEFNYQFLFYASLLFTQQVWGLDCKVFFPEFNAFTPIVKQLRSQSEDLALEYEATQKELARTGIRLTEGLRKLIGQPSSQKAIELAETAKRIKKNSESAKDILSKWEAADLALKKLSTMKADSPDYPKQLTALLTALSESSNHGWVHGEYGALTRLSPDLNHFLELIAKSPVDAESLKKANVSDSDRDKIAKLLGIPENQFKLSPYPIEVVEKLLEAAKTLSSKNERTDSLKFSETLTQALESLTRTKALLHLGTVMEGKTPIPEWERALSGKTPPLSVSFSQRVKASQQLRNGQIAKGDLGSYIAGQSSVSKALQGSPLASDEVKFAEAYLRAANGAQNLSSSPRNIAPPQRSFIEALSHHLGRRSPTAKRNLDEWVRFLNDRPQETEERSLSTKEIGLMAALVGDVPKNEPVGTNDWHRVGYLNQKTSYTTDELEFLGALRQKIEGNTDYASLSTHITGLLQKSWKEVGENQNRLRKEDLLRTTGKISLESLKSESFDKTKMLPALAEARVEYENDPNLSSLENSRLQELDRYYRDRLFGQARKLELSPEEAARAQSGFKMAAELKKSIKLPPETDQLFVNIQHNLKHYGGRPIDKELVEDLLRFQLSKSNGRFSPLSTRMILDRLSDPQKNQIGQFVFEDGWTMIPQGKFLNSELTIAEILGDPDNNFYDPTKGANKFGWEKVGSLAMGQSRNEGLQNVSREFFWNTGMTSPSDPAAMRVSIQTSSNGKRTLEGFIDANWEKKGDPIWIAFAADEVLENGRPTWALRSTVKRRNKNGEAIGEESVQKACARCHMSALGRFDPKPVGIAIPKFLDH